MRIISRLLSNAYFLLTMTTVMWAGNTIAGRLAIGNISPMAITCLRWIFSFVLLAILFPRAVSGAPKIVRERPLYITLMAILGFSAFNAVFYAAAQYTSAINLGIMQSSTPLFVMLGAANFQGERIAPAQIAGLATGLIGVIIVASRGQLAVLQSLDFNRGDVMVLLVSASYASYSLGLRSRPAEWNGLSFFAALSLMAALTSLPLLAWEIASGHSYWPTLKGWGVLAYVVLFPSLLAQIWYIKGIGLIGAARAGLLFNAIPVFASIMAVLILGEPFGWYHAAGLALVLGGISWAERNRG